MKNSMWKQPNPAYQLRCLTMSLDWNLTNLEKGNVELEHYLIAQKTLILQLQALTPFLEGTEKW